jgi:hypothetical protein
MRRYVAAPMALLSSACAMRPWTPSVSVAYYAQEIEHTQVATVPSQSDALLRWQVPPGNPWAPYAKQTLLAALGTSGQVEMLPKVSELDIVAKAELAAGRVAALGLPPDALWILDLRGPASVAFGATVSQRATESVTVIPTFNNWPADNEMVPAEETLAALVTLAPRLPAESSGATRPIFMLDAWRLAYRDEEVDDDVTDNRYMLTSSDLPDVAMLKAQGVDRVIYVVESLDDTTVEEDDLHALFEEYEEAGVVVSMMDLDQLIDMPDPSRWRERLDDRRLVVEHRVTLVDDAHFYARAHGGFGGVHGVPGHYGGGGFSFGHGGG